MSEIHRSFIVAKLHLSFFENVIWTGFIPNFIMHKVSRKDIIFSRHPGNTLVQEKLYFQNYGRS